LLHERDLLPSAAAGKTSSKFRNVRTKIGPDTFDSAMEARRWVELQHLERSGAIRSLRRQVRFQLAPAVRFNGSARQTPALCYVADFTYEERPTPFHEWAPVVEDCKGALTIHFKIKRHLMKALLGLDIVLSKPR
jgi:hypothetical protein